MIDKVLKNIIDLFYPKNICAFIEKDKYIVSEEYMRLSKLIGDFESEKGQILRESIMKKFEKRQGFKDFQDFSRLDWQDRCFTFTLLLFKEGETYSITLYMSVLLPYYVIRSRKHKGQMLFSESRIKELEEENPEPRNIEDLILDIKIIAEEEFIYKEFPKKMLNTIIDDVSFQDSSLGYFTMFNAFFNNESMNENNN